MRAPGLETTVKWHCSVPLQGLGDEKKKKNGNLFLMGAHVPIFYTPMVRWQGRSLREIVHSMVARSNVNGNLIAECNTLDTKCLFIFGCVGTMPAPHPPPKHLRHRCICMSRCVSLLTISKHTGAPPVPPSTLRLADFSARLPLGLKL